MNKDTSWEKASTWYQGLVQDKGHYYHREVIFPRLLNLLNLSRGSILDIACGDGVLSRNIPSKIEYVGIDGAPSLIKAAKKSAKSPNHQFFVGDIRKPFPLKKKDFTQATMLLAMQNIDDPEAALSQINGHLKIGGKLFIVLNHPCFRIPRQSHWGNDYDNKIQFRRVDRYLTSLEIPIQTKPSQKQKSPKVYSYHYSLSSISGFLRSSGFVIDEIEEWCSNKKSTGKYAKMEDRARSEFPLFATIVAEKARALQNQE